MSRIARNPAAQALGKAAVRVSLGALARVLDGEPPETALRAEAHALGEALRRDARRGLGRTRERVRAAARKAEEAPVIDVPFEVLS